MKNKKIFILLATISLATVSFFTQEQPRQIQAATINKSRYGFTRTFTFPKSWQGKWYSHSKINPTFMEIHKKGFYNPWTSLYTEVVKNTKIKKTNKYIWDMGDKWLNKNNQVLNNKLRVTAKNLHASKWTVLSPLDKKSTDTGLAFILKTEKINGKKHVVMFEAYPATGYVYAQYFRTKNLANKYSTHHFKNMTYSKIQLK